MMRNFYHLCGKYFLYVLLAFVLAASPSGADAQGTDSQRITFRKANADLEEVLNEIRTKTSYKIFYNADLIKGLKTNIDATNVTVDEMLARALEGHPLKYTLDDDTIVISQAPARVQTADGPRTVSGRVTDESGAPIIGASVIGKGTTIGVSTDAGGNFSLRLPASVTTLTVSFLGYRELEIVPGSSTTLSIVLEEDAQSVEDIVVTGYFTQTRSSFTGASTTISGEDLRSAGAQNLLTSLSALDPSFVQIENNLAGSNPNVMPEFLLRGRSSITELRDDYQGNPNMPLFIVDGFETTAEKVFDMDIYRINSTTILKDAAATAIYGSRGANGVVVITTIAPRTGRIFVSYNLATEFSFADLTDYNMLNASEKLELEVLAGMYEYNSSASSYYYMHDIYSARLRNVMRGVDTYWLNKPLNSVTVGHKHSLQIDGGNEAFRYAINLNYNDSPGVMKESGRTRQGIGMKFQYIYKDLTFINEMTYARVKGKNSPYGTFSDYAYLNPYSPYKNETGNYIYLLEEYTNILHGELYQYNPLFNSTLKTKDSSYYDDFTNKFSVNWDLKNGFILRGNVALSSFNNRADYFLPASHTNFARYIGDDYDRKGYYKSTRGDQFTYDILLVANYQKVLGKHVLTANAAYNVREDSSKSQTVEAEGFPNENLNDLGFALQYLKDGAPKSSEYTSRLMSIIGNVNYSYDNRYLADLSVSGDASSRFGSDNRWAPFWSVGAGWNVHNEAFMQSVDFISELKARASIGMTGSQDYDPYQALTTYKYMTGTRYHYGQGATVMAMGNENLGWQRTLKRNIGLDAEFWDKRVYIRADYYFETTKDMLADIKLPPSLGFGTYKENLGEVENKGVDASVRVNIIQDRERQLNLGVFVGIQHNTNKLKKISNALRAYNESGDNYLDRNRETEEGGSINAPRVRYVEGRSMNSIWVNQSLGIDPSSGREIFLLPNGGTTEKWSASNYVIGGCEDPKIWGNFGFNLRWKGLQLNTIFTYRLGGEIYNQTLVDRVQDADLRKNVDRRVLTDRWQKPGDISKFTGYSGSGYGYNYGQRTRPTSRFVEKYNYLTLRSLNISYDFDADLIKKLHMERLRVNFYMYDIFHLSTVKQERGIEYPYARSFSIGLQVNF